MVSVSLKYFCFSRPQGIFHLSCVRLSFAPHFLEAVVLCSAILVTESGCVSCSLLCQEAQNLLVVLVEPVLMLLSRLAKHRLCSVGDCISERRPGSLKIIVCLTVGRQVASQGILEGILHLRFAEVLHVQLLLHAAGLTAVFT